MNSEDQKIVDSASSPIEDLRKIEKNIGRVELIMTAVIVGLFIGFFGIAVSLGGLYTEAFRSKEASYSDLAKTINQQSYIIAEQKNTSEALGVKINNLIYEVRQK